MLNELISLIPLEYHMWCLNSTTWTDDNQIKTNPTENRWWKLVQVKKDLKYNLHLSCKCHLSTSENFKKRFFFSVDEGILNRECRFKWRKQIMSHGIFHSAFAATANNDESAEIMNSSGQVNTNLKIVCFVQAFLHDCYIHGMMWTAVCTIIWKRTPTTYLIVRHTLTSGCVSESTKAPMHLFNLNAKFNKLQRGSKPFTVVYYYLRCRRMQQ